LPKFFAERAQALQNLLTIEENSSAALRISTISIDYTAGLFNMRLDPAANPARGVTGWPILFLRRVHLQPNFGSKYASL